jgi:hypothetical protein
MKPTGPFLEVVSRAGEPDAEVEQVLGAARAWAEPSRDNHDRVAAALRATLPAALLPAAPLPAAVPAALPAARGSSSLSPASPGGVAPTNAPIASAARRGARLGRLPWLLIGGALLGTLGFWLGHGAGYAAGQREASAHAGEAPSGPARAASAVGLPGVDAASATALAPSAAELPAPERPSTEPPASRLGPAASEAATAASANAVASTPARSRRPLRLAERVARAQPSPEPAEPSRLSFRQVLDQLRRAQQQLRSGQATMSLLLLSELDRSAGDVLLEERDATRVLALCGAGQEAAARDVARRLQHDSPRSIYGMRLEASCVSDAPLGEDAERERSE